MLDEDDKAEMAEREREAEKLMHEQKKVADDRSETLRLQLEEVLAAQRETIKSKTPEEIRLEYGFTEGVDATKLKTEGLPTYEELQGKTKT